MPSGNATRKIEMDDDLTMLIGPAQDGSLLEIGVLDLTGEVDDDGVSYAAASQVLPVHQPGLTT